MSFQFSKCRSKFEHELRSVIEVLKTTEEEWRKSDSQSATLFTEKHTLHSSDQPKQQTREVHSLQEEKATKPDEEIEINIK